MVSLPEVSRSALKVRAGQGKSLKPNSSSGPSAHSLRRREKTSLGACFRQRHGSDSNCVCPVIIQKIICLSLLKTKCRVTGLKRLCLKRFGDQSILFYRFIPVFCFRRLVFPLASILSGRGSKIFGGKCKVFWLNDLVSCSLRLVSRQEGKIFCSKSKASRHGSKVFGDGSKVFCPGSIVFYPTYQSVFSPMNPASIRWHGRC
jgi:hypothetical protein